MPSPSKSNRPEAGVAQGKATLRGIIVKHRRALLVYAPVSIFLLVFFAAPFLALLRVSVAQAPTSGDGVTFYVPGTWTLENYIEFFSDSFYIDQFKITILIGIVISAVSTILSYALAYLIYLVSPLYKSILIMIVIMPKFTNVLVIMYGLLIVFGVDGFLNRGLIAIGIIDEPIRFLFNLFSVVLGEIIQIVPFCVLVISAVLHSLDRSLRESAAGLGASPVRVFSEVTLPLSAPAVWVSILLSLMWGIGAFVSPLLLGNPELYTMSVEIDRQANWRLNWAMGGTIAVVMTIMIFLLMWLLGRLQRRQGTKS